MTHRHTADELDLVGRQGRAAGADSGVDARLMHGDDIHVALAEDVPMGGAPLCDLEREHRVRLVVDQRFGAVDVLGLGVVQHTAAEGDDVARRSRWVMTRRQNRQ